MRALAVLVLALTHVRFLVHDWQQAREASLMLRYEFP